MYALVYWRSNSKVNLVCFGFKRSIFLCEIVCVYLGVSETGMRLYKETYKNGSLELSCHFLCIFLDEK